MSIVKHRSLRSQLTVWYALLLGIIFIASAIFLYHGFKKSLLDTIDTNLLIASQEVENTIKVIPLKEWKENIKRVERGFVVNRLFIQLLEVPIKKDEDIQVIIPSGILKGNISLKKLWAMILHQLPENPIFFNVNINEEPEIAHPLRIILYPLKKAHSKKYIIQVGISLKKMFNTLKNFQIILVLSIPFLLFLSVLGGFFILSKALQPVKSVVETARKITTEDLSLRIDAKNRKNEIGELITTFNQMISRLEHSVAQLKQFSSDASHDLKTPLTIIRGEIEIALRKNRTAKEYLDTLKTVQEEAQKLEHIIDNLLFLSRVDIREYRQSFKSIPLDELLLQLFEKTQCLALEKKIAYIIMKIDRVNIQGDSLLLNRMIMNLLDNAIKYTPPKGRVRISLEKTGNNCCFLVQDTGIGIPMKSQAFIFDRFYQVDQSRSQRGKGSGLGLSIVKKIADIHQAKVTIQSKPNHGTTIRVYFNIN